MSARSAPGRKRREELLDAEGHEAGLLARSLLQVAAVDRWLGGARAFRRHLRPLPSPGTALALLDVGTGDGTVARRLAAWLAAGGRQVRAVGVEPHPDIVKAAATRGSSHRVSRSSPELRLVRADGRRLPFADGSFDLAVSTLTLHHLEWDEAVRFVRELARVGRRILIGDLARSRLHYLGARVLAATVWRRNPLTRHDGPLSVLRSFTAAELSGVGRSAGLAELSVRRHPVFRLVLEGRR